MNQRINEIIDDAKDFGRQQAELVKLEVVEKTAGMSSEILTHVILGLIGFMLVFFVSIAGGFLFGELFNSVALGFLTIAGIYTILLLIIYLSRKSLLKKPFINYTIKKLLADDK